MEYVLVCNGPSCSGLPNHKNAEHLSLYHICVRLLGLSVLQMQVYLAY